MDVGFDAPVLDSLDPWALALSIAAMIVTFGLRASIIPTLLGGIASGVTQTTLRVNEAGTLASPERGNRSCDA